MSDFNRNLADHSDFQANPHFQLENDRDLLAEELLNNINTTPLGRLLKKIAVMPEIRQEKVTDVRGRINSGQYDLNSRLELALDKVLEELIS